MFISLVLLLVLNISLQTNLPGGNQAETSPVHIAWPHPHPNLEAILNQYLVNKN